MFKTSDGTLDSTSATVTINVSEVNDAPVAAADNKATNEDAALSFAASDLTGNDATGAANETNQTLTVTQVISASNTNGTVSLSGGQITYQPSANFNGTASFDYQVCDNGTTGGAADAKCAIGTVVVAINAINDAPFLNPISDYTVYLGSSLSVTASATDADLPNDTLTYSLVGTIPSGASINAATGAISWTPAVNQAGQIYTLTVRATDGGGLFSERQFKVGVAYEWSNLLAPVSADGSSVFNGNRTVPVKFQLTGTAQNVTDAAARLYLAKVTYGVVGTEFPATASGNSNQGNLFRFTGDHYAFNWSTKNLTAGVYRLRVDLGDGVSRTVLVTIR